MACGATIGLADPSCPAVFVELTATHRLPAVHDLLLTALGRGPAGSVRYAPSKWWGARAIETDGLAEHRALVAVASGQRCS